MIVWLALANSLTIGRSRTKNGLNENDKQSTTLSRDALKFQVDDIMTSFASEVSGFEKSKER